MSEEVRTDIDRRPPASVEDLMYVTGLGRTTVRELITTGQLPGRKLGGKYVITAGEFDSFVAGTWKPAPIPIKKKDEEEQDKPLSAADCLKTMKAS